MQPRLTSCPATLASVAAPPSSAVRPIALDAPSAVEFRFLLRDVHAVLQQALDLRLEARGVSALQAAILDAAVQQPGLNLADIGATLRIDAPAMSRHAARLESRGLCLRYRARGDRRAVHVELLPAGRALAREYAELRAEVTEAAFAGFAAHERAQLIEGLRRLTQAPPLS